jgi:type IV pilus assembly protein PilO
MNSSHPLQRWRMLIERHPGNWPRLLQYALCLLLFGIPLLTGWQISLKQTQAQHRQRAQEEQQQKQRYLQKLQQVSTLSQWQTQRAMLQQRILQHQQELFDHGDFQLLLGEVATLANRHQLLLAHAKPAPLATQKQIQARALQISLRGGYHDIGRFAAALATTARPLFLGDLQLRADTNEHELLQLDASIRSYRPGLPAKTP